MSASEAMVLRWRPATASGGAGAKVGPSASTDSVSGLVLAMYGGYCRAYFEWLARHDARELAATITENRAADSRLTYAVEILGERIREPWVAATLLDLIRTHRSPLVREGAVIGLSHHIDMAGVRDALHQAAAADPSPGVRATAQDVLDGD